MADRVRWVLWGRPVGETKYTLRRGRYASKDAALDAIKTLATLGLEFLALPEGKQPQVNLRP